MRDSYARQHFVTLNYWVYCRFFSQCIRLLRKLRTVNFSAVSVIPSSRVHSLSRQIPPLLARQILIDLFGRLLLSHKLSRQRFHLCYAALNFSPTFRSANYKIARRFALPQGVKNFIASGL